MRAADHLIDFGPGPAADGYKQVLPTLKYSKAAGFGFDSCSGAIVGVPLAVLAAVVSYIFDLKEKRSASEVATYLRNFIEGLPPSRRRRSGTGMSGGGTAWSRVSRITAWS